MSAGRVVSLADVNDMASSIPVTYCDGNVGEQNASSQAFGVTLASVAGGTVRVAVSGICCVLAGATTTAQRGQRIFSICSIK